MALPATFQLFNYKLFNFLAIFPKKYLTSALWRVFTENLIAWISNHCFAKNPYNPFSTILKVAHMAP